MKKYFIYRRKKKMENEQIKKANKKALPKFILFCVFINPNSIFVLLAKNLNKFAPSDSLLIEKLVS